MTRSQYGIAAAVSQTSLVSLRNRTGKEKKDDSKLCDKRDNNLVSKNLPPNFTFLSTDLFVEEQKTSMLSEFRNTHVIAPSRLSYLSVLLSSSSCRPVT